MADFVFYVGRKGFDPVQCRASVPSEDELPKFKGGEVNVITPKGTVKVKLSDAFTMLLASLTIELQNGVRDVIFPKDEQGSTTKTSRTGYVK